MMNQGRLRVIVVIVTENDSEEQNNEYKGKLETLEDVWLEIT